MSCPSNTSWFSASPTNYFSILSSKLFMKKSFSLFFFFVIFSYPVFANVVEVAGYRFTAPENWKSSPPSSSMRKAQFSIAGENGKNAELVFFYFGQGGGGGVRANVDRWLKQFQVKRDQSVTEEVIHSVKTTFVRAWGTFLSGTPFGPKTPEPGYSLSGAIIEGKSGALFLKMVGDAEVVDQNHPVLVDLIKQSLAE